MMSFNFGTSWNSDSLWTRKFAELLAPGFKIFGPLGDGSGLMAAEPAAPAQADDPHLSTGQYL